MDTDKKPGYQTDWEINPDDNPGAMETDMDEQKRDRMELDDEDEDG